MGNLSVGGTGKTPMVLWLANMLSKENFSIAIVSRGYGRKTKGFNWVNVNSAPQEVGDEPLLFKQSFPNAIVAVCEKRTIAIDKIRSERKPDLIILDDAFQHQYVKPSLNILLSDYSNPFYTDFLLPAGNLRELRKNKARADIIITTKCPDDISQSDKAMISEKINPIKQNVFFSSLKYNALIGVFNKDIFDLSHLAGKSVILVTGIANAKPIESKLKSIAKEVSHLEFSDHSDYTKNDVLNILKSVSTNSIIVTTTKDAVKLEQFSELKNVPLYALSVEPNFDEEKELKELILNHVRTN